MRGTLCVLLLIMMQAGAEAPSDTQQVRVGLTLSAGGAFGLAHIGVLKVLEREGIPACCISSNSMGSIIGGLYAAGYNAAQLESVVVDMDWAGLLTPSFSSTTQYLPQSQQAHRYIFRWTHDRFSPTVPRELISLQEVEFVLMRLLSKIQYDTDYSFDSLRIPLRVIAVDLVSGNRVVMNKGRLDRAIRGSIAIPGVFAPQTIGDQILVDGGVLQYFPVDPLLELEPDFIIASLTIKQGETAGVSLVDVFARTTSMIGFEDIERQKLLADVVIEPDLGPFEAQDYSRASEIVAIGEKAASAAIPKIRAKLAGRTPVVDYKTITERPIPYVKSIKFDGLKATRKQTIEDEITTAPGMPLCFDRIVDDLARLYHTGLFDHVNYRLESSTQDSVDVIFEIIEKAYGFYLLGVRYDNMDNACLGLEIGQSNVFGSGICLKAAINLGDPNEYRIGVSDRRTFTLPLGYQIDIFWNSIDRSRYEAGDWQEDYNTDCRGGRAELGYSLGTHSYVNVGMHAHQAVYRLPESPFFDTLPAKEWIIGPSFNLEANNCDDLYFPSRGSDFKFNVFYSADKIGASNEFVRLQMSLDQFIPMTSSLLLTGGLDLGVSSGDLAWANYFHTGGANFVGFMNEEFTPEQKAVIRLGLDVKLFPLFGEGSPLYLQFLSNIASFESLDELLKKEQRKLADYEIGLGVGVRTNTPIGPLRVTLGMGNPHRTPREEHIRYTIYFSIGRDFRYTR